VELFAPSELFFRVAGLGRIFCVCLGSPGGCATVYCPGLMLFFLLRVTGIPLTEELSVKSKGDAYREYQRTTSAFVPWFKKK
jgi:steroid 5-alpha reductase family enzyme